MPHNFHVIGYVVGFSYDNITKTDFISIPDDTLATNQSSIKFEFTDYLAEKYKDKINVGDIILIKHIWLRRPTIIRELVPGKITSIIINPPIPKTYEIQNAITYNL